MEIRRSSIQEKVVFFLIIAIGLPFGGLLFAAVAVILAMAIQWTKQ